jgi:hypothetical protein
VDDPYAVDAEFYDLVHEHHREDVGLWLSFAGRTDRPVLEVGTGTGRIARALSLAGHTVTAIDPSAAMLAVAEHGPSRKAPTSPSSDRHRRLRARPVRFVLSRRTSFLRQDGWSSSRPGGARRPCFNLRSSTFSPAMALTPQPTARPSHGRHARRRPLDAWQVHEDDLASRLAGCA